MNATELTNLTRVRARILKNKRVQDLLKKYSDASWCWSTQWDYNPVTAKCTLRPKLYGLVECGDIDPAIVDLLEYAYSCTEDKIQFCQAVEDFEAAGAKVQIIVEAAQPMSKSDIKLLKDIGIIQTERINPSKPKAYSRTYLACSTR